MISDHGVSRLAVINNQELSYKMAESGKHSGRCCPKSETDTQPECATESDNYWVLANYGRFKGSRKGDVEVLVEKATVETDGKLTFTLRNGMKIEV